MKKSKLSGRELIMVVFLVVLLVGVCYYMFFLTPLNKDITAINSEITDAQSQLDISQAKVASMDKMKAELEEILSRPKDEITEIAPYDNAKALMNELNGILAQGSDYAISFADPIIGDDGIVRRNVNLSFTASSYEAAKTIVSQLANNRWRCLITDLSVSSEDTIESGAVKVEAIMTFFESTNLK